MPKKLDRIDIHYEKSYQYQTYHVDGIAGAITKNGIHFDTFTERRYPLSKQVFEFTDEGRLKKEPLETIIKHEGVLRQLECGLTMDLPTAKSFHSWLGVKIKEFEKLIASKNG